MAATPASLTKPFRIRHWLPVAICLIAFSARIIPGPRTIDDAFITFRYARNILAGLGFVYNPGEYVLGTTTPLYTLIMVSIGGFTGGENAPFPLIALIFNALADTLVCYFLFLLGRDFGSRRVGIGLAFVWAVSPYSVTFAIGGLETSLYILLLLAALYFHITYRQTLTAILSTLAFLTRPDSLILLIPLACDRVWQVIQIHLGRRRTPRSIFLIIFHTLYDLRRELLILLIPICAWLCFAFIYFGNPVPQSILAKTLAYRLDPASAFIRLIQHYATPFLEHLSFGMRWLPIGIILYLFLYIAGASKAFRINPRIWPFIIFPWLYFILYALANPLIFRWYLTPPLPALFLFILIGADRILYDAVIWTAELIKSNRPRLLFQKKDFASFLAAIIVILVPFALSIQDWTFHPDHGLNRPAPEMAWYKLELLYQETASFLQPYLETADTETVTLAAGDVGVLGYFTNVRILDTVGLNSPVSSNYYPLDGRYYTINYAIPPDLIIEKEPDYLVFLEAYGREGLLKDVRFWDLYELMNVFPTDIYGSQGLYLMKHK